jgi:3-oxoacyl-[acyl-carrier-protein] synthase III
MSNVYITKAAKFLPNEPVSNDDMELYLGKIDGVASKGKNITLRSNGIKLRYYAIDKNGVSTHSNAKMTALAIEQLTDSSFTQKHIELIACGTTSPDNLLPSHAVMVHGELQCGPVELISTSGACCTSMQALKFGYTSLLAGTAENAVITGSEKLSTLMRADHFEKETERLAELDQHPIIAFEKDFLRWMLSDGAGALLLEKNPRTTTSLKIEWLEMKSFANELETCMYAGADKNEDGSVKGWKDYSSEEWLDKSIFCFKQDVKLLGKEIVPTGARYLKSLLEKKSIDVSSIDYILPHISSQFFKQKMYDEFVTLGIEIPLEKWYSNLTTVGNIGAGSIFIMLEELMNSGNLKSGQKILLMVPESARFSYAFSLLTVC